MQAMQAMQAILHENGSIDDDQSLTIARLRAVALGWQTLQLRKRSSHSQSRFSDVVCTVHTVVDLLFPSFASKAFFMDCR